MKTLNRLYHVFLWAAWICVVLLVLNFFLSSPKWDGILSDTMRTLLPAAAVSFFANALTLRAVRGALQERK